MRFLAGQGVKNGQNAQSYISTLSQSKSKTIQIFEQLNTPF